MSLGLPPLSPGVRIHFEVTGQAPVTLVVERDDGVDIAGQTRRLRVRLAENDKVFDLRIRLEGKR